jgi:DNA-binding HxlR family transcriptional regulator
MPERERLSDAPDHECPVVATARIVSGKWTLLVLRDLASGPQRFSELERSLAGISPRTLSHRLRALEEEGIVLRQVYAEVPPRVEYRLTSKGEALVPIVNVMRDYGRRWLEPDAEECDEKDQAGALPRVAATV